MCQEFTKTRFKTFPLNSLSASPSGAGIPIGQGKCSAVRLRINALVNGLPQPHNNLLSFIYYGDSQSQENELVSVLNITGGKVICYQSDWTPIIYCENLEEVFIKKPAGDDMYVQIMILD